MTERKQGQRQSETEAGKADRGTRRHTEADSMQARQTEAGEADRGRQGRQRQARQTEADSKQGEGEKRER